MNRRLALAGLMLALLTVGAGCTQLTGGGGVNEEKLARDVTYGEDWDTTTDVRINLTNNEYRAVFDLHNQSTLEVYRYQTFDEERPLAIEGVQFRYPNGTVVDSSAINVTRERSHTVIRLPASEGKVAYTVPAGGRHLRIPTYVEGSYEVVLPKNMRVGNSWLGNVRPRGYETEIDADNRQHITWGEVTADTISIRYFLARDMVIFGGLFGILAVAALVGLGYFYLQVKRLAQTREEMGLDVDVGDDEFDRKPPLR